MFIARFRNNNIKKLETPYPVDYPYWVPACEKILYECTGVNKEDFERDVLTIRGWEGYEDKYLKDKSPHILMVLIIRWMMMNNKTADMARMCHYIGYSQYWGVFTTMFKKYKPNLDVMKYTIGEMSYKSRLKSLGSVDKWLAESVNDTMMTYEERIRRGSDFELHYVQEKLRGKFKSAFKTIFRAQQKNEAAGNRVFTSKIKLKGEEGEEIIVDNETSISEGLAKADNYTSKFFSNPLDEKILQMCLVPDGITARDLRNTILLIADNRDNIEDVRKFYQSMIYAFLDSGEFRARDIGTKKFFVAMDRLYKPGNTVDPNKIFIKDCLDKWLTLGSKTFRTSNRTATITTFRKCIYNYFVIKMMKDK